MAKRDERYLQFPISLMRDLVEDKAGTLGKIIDAGIVKVSDGIKISWQDASRQVIYDLYRSSNKLCNDLKTQLRYLESEIIGRNDDPFSSGHFDVDDEVEALVHAMDCNDVLKDLVCDHYRHQQTLKFLNIKQYDPVSSRVKGRKILSKIDPKEPNSMINTRHAFDFRDKPKSDYELIQLAAFIGIKSIIGKKAYCKTNKNLILARMMGYSTFNCIPVKLKGVVAEIMKKYSTRYHMDKLLADLQLNWNVLTYSHHMRGLYIAIDGKIDLNELVKSAEAKRRKNQLEGLRSQKLEAMKLAKQLQQLK